MEELQLRKWVKVALVVIALFIVGGIMKLLDAYEEVEVRNCTDYGYSEAYCRSDK